MSNETTHTIETHHPISYHFEFADGRKRVYDILLDAQNLSFIPPRRSRDHFQPPTWTALEVAKCSLCPLNASEHPQCPIALNIAELVEHFREDYSTDAVTVRVITPERTYLKETRVQYGLFSILGIIMATSGCPIMNFLKPMARFHLPFSTHTETMVRSISIYLLRQYFLKKSGKEPDIELRQLDLKYAGVQKVNEGILARIRSVVKKADADDNAILILHTFAQILSFEIADNLTSIEYLFKEQ